MSFKLRIASLLLFLSFPMASFAGVKSGCPNSYIHRASSNRMESELYLIKIPSNFSRDGINVLATYKSISSRQNPSHKCVHTDIDDMYDTYTKGACKNLQSGRVTSIYGGRGYEVMEDGNTQMSDGYNGEFIEDSNGTRLRIFSGISGGLHKMNCSRNGSPLSSCHIIRDCNSGSIEAIIISYAFRGYVMLQRAVETGFVNTYKSTPKVEF